MNKTIVLSIIGAVVLSAALFWTQQASLENSEIPVQVRNGFMKWKALYNKYYSNPREENHRLEIFHANYLKVSSHKDESYSLALNKFADLSESEFIAMHTGYVKKPRSNSSVTGTSKTEAKSNAPTNVDWRTVGAVQAIKDQMDCGNSYAFAATSAFESNSFLKGYQLYSFSEQEITDCSWPQGNQGCNGGYTADSFRYIHFAGGLEATADYPYKGVDAKCREDSTKFKPPRVVNILYVPSNQCGSLLNEIVTMPVATSIASNAIQFYSGGVFSNKYCGTAVNHAVNIVGYGYDKPSGKNYWIVRNSWGTQWGESGYIRMDRDIQPPNGICGICMDPMYPVVS